MQHHEVRPFSRRHDVDDTTRHPNMRHVVSSPAPSLGLLLPIRLEHVAIASQAFKHDVDHGMVNRAVFRVGHQVLLGDIGLIGPALRVLGKKVIKGLILGRTPVGGYGLIPFLRIVEYGIHVENDAAKWEEPVPNDLTHRKLRITAYPLCVHRNPHAPSRRRRTVWYSVWYSVYG